MSAPQPLDAGPAVEALARLFDTHIRPLLADDILDLLEPVDRIKFLGGGHTETVRDHEINWDEALRRVAGKVLATREARDAVAAVVRDGILILPATIWDAATKREVAVSSSDDVIGPALRKLIPMLSAYFRAAGGADTFDQAAFHTVWERYRDAWVSPTVEYEDTVAFLELRVDELPLQLGHNATLERLTNEQKGELWNEGNWVNMGIAASDLSDSDVCIRGRHTVATAAASTVIGGLGGPVVQTARHIMAAVRLATGERIGALAIRRETRPVVFRQIGVSSMRDGTGVHVGAALSWPTHVPNPLSSDQINQIIVIFGQLSRTPDWRHLSHLVPALRRYDQSLSRESDDDALVDLVISLEGSLLFGLQAELNYRAGMRAAAILSASDPTTDVFSLIKSAYDARSKMVHEGLTLAEYSAKYKLQGQPDHRYFVRHLRGFVRRILVRYLAAVSSGHSPKTLNADLDKATTAALKGCILPPGLQPL